ncbi:MAG: hypothetical protein QOK04_1613, partial [Solirubrobacteraceae bacterium]|nr:hypothetical protein [Solirubrobacteraceae bacterium]
GGSTDSPPSSSGGPVGDTVNNLNSTVQDTRGGLADTVTGVTEQVGGAVGGPVGQTVQNTGDTLGGVLKGN